MRRRKRSHERTRRNEHGKDEKAFERESPEDRKGFEAI